MVRKLLKNPIILTFVLVMSAVVILSVWMTHSAKEKEGWDSEAMRDLDWVIEPGVYWDIIMEEVDGQTVFLADHKFDGKMILDEQGKPLLRKGLERMYTTYNSVEFHPAGYGVVLETDSAGNDSYRVENLDGDVLYTGGSQPIKLTEMAGYILPGDGSVVSLETRERIYTPKEGEAVGRQQGDYWVMTITFPWKTEFNSNTLCYLRNLDFSIAQDGKLFSYVGFIDGDRVMGTVLDDYDYYGPLPEYDAQNPKLAETNVILDGAGNSLLPEDGKYSSEDINFTRYNWFETREYTEDTFVTTIHFLDNMPEDDEALKLEPGMVLWSLSEDGLMIFADPGHSGGGEDFVPERRGVMNRQGDVLLPPIFHNVLKAENNYAVVVLASEYGVIRIGGDGDEG